ncbi:MFS transporter [Streptomyces sp. CA-111067]|uniref:MFS transporter n=1 Tax=Streptomyces sp. CA-111067 TaxID=3240046 RepID=UPI003D991E9B
MAEQPASTAPEFVWTGRHTVALALLCLAQLIELIDVTVVNVTLPTMQRDLHFTPDSLSWVINAYTVVFGGLLLLGSRVGDLLGRRRVFLSGVALFTAASLASGLAQNADMLITTRALQGLSAAFVAPMTLAIIATTFPEGRARNRALAIWGGTAGISGSLGVTVGGLIAGGPGWRWIFFVNIPLGLLMLALAPRFLAADRPARRHRSFDTAGAVAVTAGFSLFAYAVSQTGEHPWGSARTIGLLAGSAALLGYLVVHETRIAQDPLIPFSIFANRSVTGANAVAALVGGGMVAMFYFISLYLQQTLHYSAVKAGLMYLPMTGTVLVFAGVAPLLVPLIGVRYVLVLGTLVAAAGLLVFAHDSPTGGLWRNVVLPSVLAGLGLALTFVPMTIASVAGVPPSMTGLASGLANVSRTAGGALGLSVTVSIAASRTAHRMAAGHPQATALSDGFTLGFTVSAAVMAAAAVAAFALFRGEGRGEKVDFMGLAAAGLDE